METSSFLLVALLALYMMPTGELTQLNLLSESVLLLNISARPSIVIRLRKGCGSKLGFFMFVAFWNKRSSQESAPPKLFFESLSRSSNHGCVNVHGRRPYNSFRPFWDWCSSGVLPYDNRAFSVISVKIMDVFAFASFSTFLGMTVSFYQRTKK